MTKKTLFLITFTLLFIFIIGKKTAIAQYTLSDNDVVVINGIIESCSYNFAIKDIIIPATLDGQTVIGIGDDDDNLFYSKGITSIQFPNTIQSIGYRAFGANDILNLDLSSCINLISIGNYAFVANNLETLNINCSSLKTIGNRSFYSNNLTSLDLSSCHNLQCVEDEAFRYNGTVASLDLSNCTNLSYIGYEAFKFNLLSVTNFVLPTSTNYESYGWIDGNNNTYIGGETVNDIETSYRVPYPYSLTNDDVEVIDGVIISCSYNFSFKDIIIPTTLDGQTVIGIGDDDDNLFYSKEIASVQFPNTIQSIGYRAFYSNNLTNLDLSNCNNLNSIGYSAFKYNSITSFVLPIVTNYESYEWIDGNKNTYSSGTSVTDLSTDYRLFYHYTLTDSDVEVVNGEIISCSYNYRFKDIIIPIFLDAQTVFKIGEDVFYRKGIKTVQLPNTIQTIGRGAFGWNSLTSLDLSSYANLTSIGSHAFGSNRLNSINFSNCTNLISIGTSAFWFNSITNIDLSNCTNLISIETYAFFSYTPNISMLLPIVTNYESYGWIDGNGNTYSGGGNCY